MEPAADDLENQAGLRSGRCAIVGRPNVGKSTLLNALLGQKLVIATSKPGTTRSAVLGVFLQREPLTQIAFVDTPGIARAKTSLHKVLVDQARIGLDQCDVALFLTDVVRPRGARKSPLSLLPADEPALAALANLSCPVVLAINKIDLLPQKEALLPLLQALQERANFDAVVPISATKKTNLKPLISELRKHLPARELLCDEDTLTDRPERFFAAELVREALLRRVHGEVPYGAAVLIESFKREGSLVRIRALILVEKNSHKGIVIGKGGEQIKAIGTEARHAIERFLDTASTGQKVFLELFVRVEEGWSADPEKARRYAVEVDG